MKRTRINFLSMTEDLILASNEGENVFHVMPAIYDELRRYIQQFHKKTLHKTEKTFGYPSVSHFDEICKNDRRRMSFFTEGKAIFIYETDVDLFNSAGDISGVAFVKAGKGNSFFLGPGIEDFKEEIDYGGTP